MIETTYDEIFTLFDEITNNYNRRDQYFDILYDSSSSTRIQKSSSSEDITLNTKTSGVVARTFTGNWEEVAVDISGDIDIITKRIPKVKNKGETIAEFEGWQFNKELKPKIDPNNISIEEKVNKVREVFDYVMKYDERIFNANIAYLETLTERIFVNNEGCQLRQSIPRASFIIMPLAREGNVVDYDYLTKSGAMGFEITDLFTNEVINEAVENSLELLQAELPPSGKHTVILDPSMAGMIAHESFGHGLEADQVLRDRSYLKKHLNAKVASDICTIYDTPSYENSYGSYFFDDEGIRAGNNLLVENGILKNFIYDRRSASAFNAQPQGNGRRENYAHPVHPRMSNTYFGLGDQSLDEMISEIKYGVIMEHGSFGMEDPLGGGMQCTSRKAYLIQNGEKAHILKGTALSGAVLDLLKNIDAVSNDPIKLVAGTCGKGHEDLIPVCDGAPYIRANNALISPG
jgi:TldD protein